MAGVNQLYVISFSHFCEAGRWALQASQVKFNENRALPGLHRLLFPAKDSSGDKVTPFVKKPDGSFVKSSWEILEWSGRGAVPADVKGTLDERVGPAIRSVFYSYMLDHPSFGTQIAQSSMFQRALWALAGRVIKGVLRDLMVKDDSYVEEQKAKLAMGWQALEEKMHGATNPFQTMPDGKPNSACIALCAIAGAILAPENQYGNVIKAVPLDDLPDGLREIIHRYRATPLGEYILKVYKEQRML